MTKARIGAKTAEPALRRLIRRVTSALSRSQASAETVAEARERAEAYRMLGLEPGADPELVRQAFRRLAALHHPDRYARFAPGDRAYVMRRFSEISAAYHAIVT